MPKAKFAKAQVSSAKAGSTTATKADSPMVTEAYGGATSLGEDTLSTVKILSSLKDKGPVTFARGEVTATAYGSSENGGTYATTQTGANVSDADLVLSRTKVATGGGTTSGSEWSFETSTTRYFAIDIEGFTPRRGQITIESRSSETVSSAPVAAQGNAATFSVDSTATGANSLVQVESSALATDGFSDATVVVTSAAETPHNDFLLV